MGRAVYTRTIRKPLDRCELTQTSPCKIRDTHTVCISQGHVSHRAGHVMARTFADGMMAYSQDVGEAGSPVEAGRRIVVKCTVSPYKHSLCTVHSVLPPEAGRRIMNGLVICTYHNPPCKMSV
jgi:hypothetical protein